MSFELTTSEFSGPIEALLQLIEKRKLPINDISLAELTDEYLHFVQSLKSQETISNRIHFVYIASTLALIKSKSLLPNLELSSEEETDIEQLKQRLRLYQYFQDIALNLKNQFASKTYFFEAKDKPQEVYFQAHESINQDNLSKSLLELIETIPEAPLTKKEAHVRITVHIEEIMGSLLDRIKHHSEINFQSFLTRTDRYKGEPKKQKVYALVSFLALLELVRNHGLNVTQDKLFSDIQLSNPSLS